MSRRTGKPPACTDYFHCTFNAVDDKQMQQHRREYHEPQPILMIKNASGLPSVPLHRDPSKGMYFACAHPDCDHTSITRDNACRHYRTCRLVFSLRQQPTTAIAAVTQRRRMAQSKSKQQQRHRQSLVLPHRRFIDRRACASSSRTVASGHLHVESGSDYPSSSTHTNPASSSNLDDATAAQLLATMSRLTSAVTGLSKQLDRRAKRVSKMGEQMDWLAEEVDDIRRHHTGLSMHTYSLRRKMGKVERHMEDLVQDNRDVRGRVKGIRVDLGTIGDGGRRYR